MNNPLESFYLERHAQYLEKYIQQLSIPAKPIQEGVLYALFPGGKRIRPLLVYLIGDLLQVPLDTLDVIAASIELMHNYSLVHDDLPAMDNDDLRRGKPSCHKVYGEAQAILIGDGMQALAIEILITELEPLLPALQILAVTKALIQACGIKGMVSGQSFDLTELAKSSLTETELNTIHQLKTGKVLSACIEMVLATQIHPNPKLHEALRAYIHYLGLVFQIQDDYLDHYAGATILGKAGSSDTLNQKKTFASIYSKDELKEKIYHLYQKALTNLIELEVDTSKLLLFTQELQARSK